MDQEPGKSCGEESQVYQDRGNSFLSEAVQSNLRLWALELQNPNLTSTSLYIHVHPRWVSLLGESSTGQEDPSCKQALPLWLSTNILRNFTSQNNTSTSHNGFRISRTGGRDQGGTTWLLSTDPAAKVLTTVTTTPSPETHFTALLKDQAGG